jgi:LmbE family N-acetylglucosaminyl deacetylase
VAASDHIPASALAVYAHPDDPEISAGGTLARWAEAGAEVWVLVTTRGDKGTQDPATDTARLAELRVEETAKAAALLGFAGTRHLAHPDGELVDDLELRGSIVRVIREVQPEVVLCPDPTAVFFGEGYYNHRDHRVTGWATLDAVAPAAGNPHYFPEHLTDGLAVHHVRAVYLSGTLEPNCWIDISATLERKIDALFCHASQLPDEAASCPTKRGSGSATSSASEPRRPARPRTSVSPNRSAGSPSGPDAGGPLRRWVLAPPLGHRPQHEHRDDADAAGADGRADERADHVGEIGLGADVGDAVADDPAEDPGQHHAAEGEQVGPARRQHRRRQVARGELLGSRFRRLDHRPMVLPCRSSQRPGR